MAWQSVIPPSEVITHLSDPEWVVVDCRYSLADTERGRKDYLEAHIPGAVYADLDQDLSGTVIPGKTGRHPLPLVEDFVRTASEWGIDSGVQVVAYDDVGGAYAARLWWLLHWLGHQAAAVLNGGWAGWRQNGYPIRSGEETNPPREFIPHLQEAMLVGAAEVDAMRTDPAYRVFDARNADRFRGENETIDPVAGHIPGAISAPYEGNLAPDGSFLPAPVLRERYLRLMERVTASHTAFYCGSGVTAAHNLLALEYAGLGRGKLYAGSWSEWITNPERPVER